MFLSSHFAVKKQFVNLFLWSPQKSLIYISPWFYTKLFPLNSSDPSLCFPVINSMSIGPVHFHVPLIVSEKVQQYLRRLTLPSHERTNTATKQHLSLTQEKLKFYKNKIVSQHRNSQSGLPGVAM